MGRVFRTRLPLFFAAGLRRAALAGETCPGAGCTAPVATESGLVIGYESQAERQEQSVSFFGALPFANPPVGDQRFHYPEPFNGTWEQPRLALTLPPPCVQAGGPTPDQSEDCLYLNVWTPSAALGTNQSLPVMFWIHGGGFSLGSSYGGGLYDGGNIAARHELVVVTHQYRLNLLGFNTYTSGPHGETGSQAMHDQRLAMAWVQRNIANFGGDPSRVTIFGESAGGFSVMYHLVSQPSRPLFAGAIMESGTSKVSWFFQPEALARELNEGYASAIGCNVRPFASDQSMTERTSDANQMACLQAMDVAAFANPPEGFRSRHPLYPFFSVGPVIDGTRHGLLDVPLDLVAAGDFARVPLLIGGNKDEGSIFAPAVAVFLPDFGVDGHYFVRDDWDVEFSLNRTFGPEDVPKILEVYPSEEFEFKGGPNKYQAQLSRGIRDVTFLCSNRALATQWAAHGERAFVYTFSFNHGRAERLFLGDYHSSELNFVWRNMLHGNPIIMRRATIIDRMADIVSCSWASFAYSGNPNGSEDPSQQAPGCETVHGSVAEWPVFGEDRMFYSLREEPVVVPIRPDNTYPDDEFPSDRRCDVWDQASFPWLPPPSRRGEGVVTV